MLNNTVVLDDLLDIIDCFREIQPSEMNFQEMLILNQTPAQAEAGSVREEDHPNNGVNILIGEGTTLAGVAKFFINWGPIPDWAKNLTTEQYEVIGLKLFQWGMRVVFKKEVDITSKDLIKDIVEYWATGVMLPVPALLVPSLPEQPNSPYKLIIDKSPFELIVQFATHQRLARLEVRSLLDFNPFAYPIPYKVTKNGKEKDSQPPSPQIIAQHRTEVFDSYVQKPAEGNLQWQQRLRWNPYAAVLPIIHLLDKLSDDQQRVKLINAIFDRTTAAISQHDLDQIAQTSAGIVLLRAAFLRSERLSAPLLAEVRNARERIATALGITVDTDLRACNPRFQDPPQEDLALEPPLPGSANPYGKRVNKLNFARSFLGRRVNLVWTEYHEWGGPSTGLGSLYPDQYFVGLEQPHWMPNEDCQRLTLVERDGMPLTDAQLADRLRVINAIFENEALADGGRSADRALLSVGMQQFSFHVESEGTVLFRRIRGVSELWFDVFIRSAGFDVGLAPVVDFATLQKENVLIDLPVLDRPEASSADVSNLDQKAWLILLSRDGHANQWCVPGRVGKKSVKVKKENGKTEVVKIRAYPVVTGDDTKSHTDCHWAMGVNETRAGRFTEQLVARWVVGARFVPEFIQAHMELCVNRFNQVIVDRDARWNRLFNDLKDPSITFEALLWSPAHVAILIDCFINTPAVALPAARRAYDLAKTAWFGIPEVPTSPDINDPQFRKLMLLAYLSERCFYTAEGSLYSRGKNIDTALERVGRIIKHIEQTKDEGRFGLRQLKLNDKFNW